MALTMVTLFLPLIYLSLIIYVLISRDALYLFNLLRDVAVDGEKS